MKLKIFGLGGKISKYLYGLIFEIKFLIFFKHLALNNTHHIKL